MESTGAATMENSVEGPEKIKEELSYDPATPLLGIYLKNVKIIIKKDTYIPMFIALLF